MKTMKQLKHLRRLLCAAVLATLCAAPLRAQTLTLTSDNYTTYLEPYTSATDFDLWRPKNTDYLKTVMKLIWDASMPRIFLRDVSSDGRMRSLEEAVFNDYKYFRIVLESTKLRKATIQNSTVTTPISLQFPQSFLSLDDITSDRKFFLLDVKRANVTDLSRLYSMLDFATNADLPDINGVLQLNGGKYHRLTMAGVDDGTYNPTNLIREIDMSRIPSQLRMLLIRFNLLEKMPGINHPRINELECYGNLMWSLDLSSLTAEPKNHRVSPQKPVADLTVVKGAAADGSQDELRLYLPEGQSELFNNSRLVNGSVKVQGTPIRTQAIQGTTNKYFKLRHVSEDNVNADLDLYAKHDGFSYQYNNRPALADSYGDWKYMRVEVKTYPYIMYIHPATKSGQGVNYYSGTLWLDYDAIVPDGTTVWIVTGIDQKAVTRLGTTHVSNQLRMEKIGDPGDLIPAGTAMYVRSTTQAGLYDFQKAWTHDIKGWDGPSVTSTASDTLWYDKVLTAAQQTELAAKRALIGNRNLLEGQGTAKTFANKREALTLGLENQKGTGTIGLWPFNGTVVPAHRCYISEATYRRVTGDASAKGGTFFFNDAETTGITLLPGTDTAPKDDAWYSLDGRRLTGKPSQKGIYVHNGRKEVVR